MKGQFDGWKFAFDSFVRFCVFLMLIQFAGWIVDSDYMRSLIVTIYAIITMTSPDDYKKHNDTEDEK